MRVIVYSQISIVGTHRLLFSKDLAHLYQDMNINAYNCFKRAHTNLNFSKTADVCIKVNALNLFCSTQGLIASNVRTLKCDWSVLLRMQTYI